MRAVRLRVSAASVVLAMMGSMPAWADMIYGRVVSLDFTVRQLPLESGETFNLLDSVAADQLAVDQTVHVVSTDGTVDAVSVDVIQDIPETINSDNSDTSTSTSTDVPSDDAAWGTSDPATADP